MFFMLLYCLFLSMTQVESKLSEKVDIVNNIKINDWKEDITIMEFIETLIYLQAVNSFRFKTIARGGFWIDPLCIRLLNKYWFWNVIDSTLG